MTLQEKVQNLRLEAALAIKHAQGWQGLIDKYGEDKATQFYLHLGLNHLNRLESPETKTCESCEVLKADAAAISAELQEAQNHIEAQDQRIISQDNEIKNRIAAEESVRGELTAYRKALDGLRRIQDLKQQAEDAQAWGDQQHSLWLQEKTRADKAEAELASYKEKKSFDFEGLTLSREPKEHEKIAVKGIAQAQESSKEAIGKILLSLREELISDGLKGIKKLKPASYHELTLQASSAIRISLRDRLIKVHKQGRMLVARELGLLPKGFAHEVGCNEKFIKNDPPGYQCKCEFKAAAEDEFDDLDDLTDLTDARIANDVQSRITAAATRFNLLGLTGAELETAIQNEVTAGSVTYIDRAATGLANRVINIGRTDEAQSRRDEWGRVEYSALLDQNVCGPCASEDGQEADNEADLTPTPNPECEGGDWCRCFHIFIQD